MARANDKATVRLTDECVLEHYAETRAKLPRLPEHWNVPVLPVPDASSHGREPPANPGLELPIDKREIQPTLGVV